MPQSFLVVLVPGFDDERAAVVDAFPTPPARGRIAPVGWAAPDDERCAILSGVPPPGDPARTVLRAAADYGKAAWFVGSEGSHGRGAVDAVAGLVNEGAALVVAELPDPSWVRLAERCRGANVLIVGYANGASASGLLAAGPDITPGVWVEARIVDIQPTVLAHLGVLAPPGPPVDGRPLTSLFQWGHPRWHDRAELVGKGVGSG